MNVDAYLRRINYSGSLDPSPETLRNLHVAHLLSVPFENLDIHLGRPIILEDAALFDKIVERKRGGFCYELNGLFCRLLRELGFAAVKLSAAVANPEGGFDPYFDHMALSVQLDRLWLADVGFGDSFRRPLLLDEPGDQPDDSDDYAVERSGDELILMQRSLGDSGKPQYRFLLQPFEYEDYAEMCHFHQTSPESPFTKGEVCTLATPEGRITLRNMRLITTLRGDKQERLISDQEERRNVLRDLFGIDLGDERPI